MEVQKVIQKLKEIKAIVGNNKVYYADKPSNNETIVCVGDAQLCKHYGVKEIGEIPKDNDYEATDFTIENGFIIARYRPRIVFRNIAAGSADYITILDLISETSYLDYIEVQAKAAKTNSK